MDVSWNQDVSAREVADEEVWSPVTTLSLSLLRLIPQNIMKYNYALPPCIVTQIW